MKTHFWFYVILLFVQPSFAQPQEKPASGQLWYCFVETVDPARLDDYRGMSIELAALAQEHDFPFAFYVWATRGMDYQVWYPVQSMDDIQKIESAWEKLMGKWGEYKAREFGKTKLNNFSFTLTTQKDLCYEPENPAAEAHGFEFCQMQEFYLVSHMQNELKEVIREANKILAAHDYPDAWYYGQAGVGVNLPALFSWSYATDMITFLEQEKKFQEQYGELFEPLYQQFSSCIKSVKITDLFYVKAFSYEKAH
ncbi:hypothetical protein [Gaoshiqia sp. Z1-71]|uniref:hypothetical protein n=1 Tax=Gaoshiqia hydrogeniformans TaxID=3290090 RepID=UPI003BF91DD9